MKKEKEVGDTLESCNSLPEIGDSDGTNEYFVVNTSLLLHASALLCVIAGCFELKGVQLVLLLQFTLKFGETSRVLIGQADRTLDFCLVH